LSGPQVLYRVAAGLLTEEIGSSWAVFSRSTGASHLLNDTSAAVLESLLSAGSRGLTAPQLIDDLAQDRSELVAPLRSTVPGHCEELLRAGLIERAGVA